jgi:hemolysin III
MAVTDVSYSVHYPTRGEKLADGWVHWIGLIVFAIAVFAALGLAMWRGGADMASAVGIYAAGVLAMIGCSLAYNMMENSKRRSLLRRFDHAAIFLMIAGSYTPFTTQRLQGGWAIGMTMAVWAIALAGVAGKLFLPDLSKKIWLALYVALGWIILAAIPPFVQTVPLVSIILLLIGGIIYTLGVPFYTWERLPFRRAIWHGFVVTGAMLHWAAVLVGVVLAPAALG